MTRQTRRFPLPKSLLAVVVIATLAGCAAGVALGTMLGDTVSITASTATGGASKTTA